MTEKRDGATLLSIRQNLMHRASVGIDDIERTSLDLPKGELSNLNTQVRRLLNKEFGYLRVYKYKYGFTVGHQCHDTLVAGLLRVQYHAKQMKTTPLVSDIFEDSDGVPVSWGVGDTDLEADSDRLKRLSQKRF